MILIHFIIRHKVLYYMHKYVIVIHYILQDANIWWYYFKKEGPISWPTAICEAKHASPKWMNDDEDHLKSFETKKAKQKERKRFHQETFTNVAAYIWWYDGKTWMSYLRHTTSSKSNVNHFIINHCSDPCLQNVHNIFLEITGLLLSIYNQSSEEFSYWTRWIGQPRDTKNS